MALFPKIESPCPYPGNLDDIVSAGKCTLCDKIVHDLTAMTDEGRRQLVESRKGDLCVRYTVLRPALAAMALGAMSLGATAATARDHHATTSRHSSKKQGKARSPAPRSIIVPVVLAGAPLPLPSAVSDTDKSAPPSVIWTKETPAKDS